MPNPFRFLLRGNQINRNTGEVTFNVATNIQDTNVGNLRCVFLSTIGPFHVKIINEHGRIEVVEVSTMFVPKTFG